MDQCCWTVFYLIRGHLKYKFGYQKCIYMAGLEIMKVIFDVWTRWPCWKMTFLHCWDTESDTQSNIFFLYTIPRNQAYHTWSHNHIWVSRWRFGISIFGTQMTIILDLVNKSLTNVAEMHFIGFVDPENISLDTKSIFLAGLEIKIS